MSDMAEDTDITESSGQVHIEWTIKELSYLTSKIGNYKESSSFSLGYAGWWLYTYSHSEAIEHCGSNDEIVEISAPDAVNVGNTALSAEIVKISALNAERSENIVDWLALCLVKSCSTKKYRVAYKIGIKKIDGSELLLFEKKDVFDLKKESRGQSNFIRISELLNASNALTSNDTLVVFCTARIVDIMTSTAQTSSSEGISTLTKDFKDLYISRLYSDVILNVKSREFHAHKAVLAARSTMFSTTFENEIVEKSGGIVDISDCDPDTFERFLLFLYTGKLERMSCTEAISLYMTADKYNLKELKEECMYLMRRQLTVDSFCDVVHLAITQNESHLQDVITDYFISNAKSILRTTQWITFLQENPLFGNKLFLRSFECKKQL